MTTSVRQFLSYLSISLAAFIVVGSLAGDSFANIGADRTAAVSSRQAAELAAIAAVAPPLAVGSALGSGSGSAIPAAIGSAAPYALPTEPIENLGASISEVSGLWRSGLYSSALILLGYMILLALSLKVPWFTKGKRAVYLGAALGFLGTIIQSAADAGTTPNLQMTLTAGLTAAALILNPTKASEIAEKKAHAAPKPPAPPLSGDS